MKQGRIVVLGFAACVVATGVNASAGLSSSGESSVKFEAQGPAGMKITGTSGGVRATEADGKIKIVAPTTEFHTGIELRDKHLRDYLEAAKHPQATFVVDRAKLTLPSGSSADGSVAGELTIHGVTRQVQVKYRISGGASGYKVHGDVGVNISEFGIKKPCYLGVCVGDAVKISADFSVHES
jgi:polyisoprenoid-binding protein YceI